MSFENYFYIHTISYYLGNNRKQNIFSVIEKLNKYKMSLRQNNSYKNLFIIYILYDTLDNAVKTEFDDFYNYKTDKLDILVLYRYNTGGTVQTMYYTYKYLLQNNITSQYLGFWEDDSIFKHENLLDIVEIYLNKDYILVGSISYETRNDISYLNGTKQFILGNSDRKYSVVPWCKKRNIYNENNSNELIDDSLYKWVDGCVYITTIENLKKINNKMNKFTLAPKNERYTHQEHGINYGEVGFCTRLNINGFNFIGLQYDENFCFLDQNTIGDKNI